jgi:hypothetical protein
MKVAHDTDTDVKRERGPDTQTYVHTRAHNTNTHMCIHTRTNTNFRMQVSERMRGPRTATAGARGISHASRKMQCSCAAPKGEGTLACARVLE